MQKKLDIPYRGNRDYLHSDDIYRALADDLKSFFPGGIASLRIKFNNLAYSGLTACFWEKNEKGNIPARTNGLFWFSLDTGRSYEGYLVENGEKNNRRIAGFEAEISSCTKIAEKSATVHPVAGADQIEHIVFAGKKLHNAVMPIDSGRWIVVEFNFNKVVDAHAVKPITVTIEDNYSDKLTQSSVAVGEDRIGNILFLILPENTNK